MKKSKDCIGNYIEVSRELLRETLLTKGEDASSIEEKLFHENIVCGKPVLAIRQRELKYEPLTTNGTNRKTYTGLWRVDSGLLDDEGCLLLKVKADAPRYLIHYFVDKFLDVSKPKKDKNTKKRFRDNKLDAIKAGKEISKELQSGKNLLQIAKKRTGLNKNPAYNKIVKAEYEKVKRYFKVYQASI